MSVATVDRVLNARHRVRGSTAERVLRAAEAIGFHAAALLKKRLRSDAPERSSPFCSSARTPSIRNSAPISRRRRGRSRSFARAPLSISRPTSPPPSWPNAWSGWAKARTRSPSSRSTTRASATRSCHCGARRADFRHPHRAGAEAAAPYVGRDNRKEGRTAAWLIAKAARRPGKVGIIVGSHRFLCQETAEISFRAYLRENAPEFTPLEPLVNLEEPRIAYAATQDMIATHPDLAGLYICGGGKEGVIAGARDEPRSRGLAIVCNELTAEARAGLIDGVLTAVISTPTALLAERALGAMAAAIDDPQEGIQSPIFVPFELYLPTNI